MERKIWENVEMTDKSIAKLILAAVLILIVKLVDKYEK